MVQMVIGATSPLQHSSEVSACQLLLGGNTHTSCMPTIVTNMQRHMIGVACHVFGLYVQSMRGKQLRQKAHHPQDALPAYAAVVAAWWLVAFALLTETILTALHEPSVCVLAKKARMTAFSITTRSSLSMSASLTAHCASQHKLDKSPTFGLLARCRSDTPYALLLLQRCLP